MKAFYTKDICECRILYLLVIACIGAIATYGCREKKVLSEGKNGRYVLSNDIDITSDDVLVLVRLEVIKKCQALSEQEKELILRSVPKTGRYQMAKTFGQYFWIWNLPMGRSVGVFYTGDLKPSINTEYIVVRCSSK
ncbi:MAG: hypothetical protein ACYS67_15700 [Planctomycetota bacterium]|jgi:hypothetical protein